MDFIRDELFDEYIEKYKKLQLNDKKRLVEEEIKELLVVLNQLNTKNRGSSKLLFNREILDLKKSNSNEDDFVEAIFVYIYAIKELIANYVENIEK